MSQTTQVALIALLLFFAVAGVSAFWPTWRRDLRKHTLLGRGRGRVPEKRVDGRRT
jgi:hypothetical protein